MTTGGDVTALQTFLGALLSVAPTGYFGPLTRAAVATWQAANSVSPTIGYVGPLTRAAIERYCAGIPPTVTAACPIVAITHDLSLGTTDTAVGGDVSSLQTFLGLSATGYFDAATKQSVISWQASNSVSPAVGYVGPLTRAAIIKRCNPSGGSTVDVSFSATPSTGTAPLAVAFSSSGVDLGTGQYIIDYGDSATSGALQSYCSTSTDCSLSANHTYTSAGVYTASLSPYIACQWSTPRCLIASQLFGTATITVGALAAPSTLIIPGSVTLAPGGSASAKGAYFTYTLTLNTVHLPAPGETQEVSARFTWSESRCGTSGCLGPADPASQTFTLYLSGGTSSYTTALGHAIVLTAVGANSATVDVPK